MRRVTHSDSEGSSNDEYENFEDDYGTRESGKGSVDRSNTFVGRNSQSRINQHYDPQTGGNYYDPRANDRRDANPYQSTYNGNHHVNGRNNIHSSRNHNDGRRNDSHLQQEKDRACILQCFFQELKMVRQTGPSLSLHFRFVSLISTISSRMPTARVRLKRSRLQMLAKKFSSRVCCV